MGTMCTAVLINWDPATPPLPRTWAHIRGRYWSAKIEETSLCNPLPPINEIAELTQWSHKLIHYSEGRTHGSVNEVIWPGKSLDATFLVPDWGILLTLA
jgi:hypothetical protein